MRLLILLALCLVPISAFAQSVPPLMPFGANDSVTVVYPAPGIDYYYDQSGNSATIIEPTEGLRWYSAEDRHGRITSQGYIFEPIPPPKPLVVPESMRFEPPPIYPPSQ